MSEDADGMSDTEVDKLLEEEFGAPGLFSSDDTMATATKTPPQQNNTNNTTANNSNAPTVQTTSITASTTAAMMSASTTAATNSKKRAKPTNWSFRTLFDIISNSANAQTISWQQDGKSFKVLNQQALLQLLNYDSTAKFSTTFAIKLHRNGFTKKYGTAFSHPNFIYGRPELLINIKSTRVTTKKKNSNTTAMTNLISNNTNATPSSQTAQQNYVSGGSINVQNVVAGGTSGGYMAVAAAGAGGLLYNYNMQQQYYNQITNSNPQQLSTLISVYKASTYDQIRTTVPVLSHFSDYDIQSHIKVLEERLQQMLQQMQMLQQVMLLHTPQAKSSSIATAVGKGKHTLESSGSCGQQKNKQFKPITANTTSPAAAVARPSCSASTHNPGVFSEPAPATPTVPALEARLQQTKPASLSGKGDNKKPFVRYVKF